MISDENTSLKEEMSVVEKENVDTIECFTKIKLSEEEREYVEQLYPIRTFKKGTYLLKEGQISNTCYYILKGCVRQFYLIDGEEKTTFFYTEEQSILENTALKNRSKYYLACVEDTTVSITTQESEDKLYKRFPRFETMCRMGVQEELNKYQDMLATYITSSPKERYINILKNRPDLLERVPQYQLASFLGIKPESLSRIRKRIMRK